MPIYEYVCKKCDEEFESLVLGQDAPTACPACNSKKIKRLLSSCGFISKGKGGETTRSSASSCSGCASTNCSNCGH
jgi:putative FmdB family regulatory protein